MSLLELGTRPPQAPLLVHDPVRLRPAVFEDSEAWIALREHSRQHLTAWEPEWQAEEMTASAFRRRVRAYWRDLRRGVCVPLLVFRQADDALVGGVTLSNIRYGASRSATLGYWVGAPYVRKGYARAAIAAILRHAFRSMELNRVDAACQPQNVASQKLLIRSGFAQEGMARDYLRINGVWRDHLLFAATAATYAPM